MQTNTCSVSYFSLIKIDAIDSTNEEVKRRFHRGDIPFHSVLYAHHQTHGKGQRNAQWDSMPRQNLTFSILIPPLETTISVPFDLSMRVALAVKTSLSKWSIPQLKIKWPNDILSGSDKICGLLIETIFRGTIPVASIIGIGLNVNQTEFDQFPMVSSLRLITGQWFNLEEVLWGVLDAVEAQIKSPLAFDARLADYHDNLYGYKKTHAFKQNDQTFRALISGVTPEGYLVLDTAEGKKMYTAKQVQLIR